MFRSPARPSHARRRASLHGNGERCRYVDHRVARDCQGRKCTDARPEGNSGFLYQFAATSNGTYFQYSSENTAYAPAWDSAGTVVDGGFTITMRIPYKIMRVPSDTLNLQGVVLSGSSRPQPRGGFYALGQAGMPSSGLSTSRLGADYSVPATAQWSFYGTIHTDFSTYPAFVLKLIHYVGAEKGT